MQAQRQREGRGGADGGRALDGQGAAHTAMGLSEARLPLPHLARQSVPARPDPIRLHKSFEMHGYLLYLLRVNQIRPDQPDQIRVGSSKPNETKQA